MSLKNWISLHIPTPRYMSMAHVGVAISLTNIHIAEIRRRGSHLELGKYGVEGLVKPLNYNEPLASDAELVEILRRIQKHYHLDFVEVSIPEELAYIYTADLPVGDEETIRNHIELHLEENVPLSLEDSVYDYHAIEKPFSGSTTKAPRDNTNNNAGIVAANVAATNSESTTPITTAPANVAEDKSPVALPDQGTFNAGPTFSASISVVPRTIVDQYIELFDLAGMTPVSFLVENQALSKSIIKAGDMDTKLIVHVGDRKSVLSVVSKGSVHFTSTVNIGSEDFTGAIMKEFNVSRDEAIRMKTERGSIDESQTSIFMTLINTASALKDEVDHIVLYWQSYVGKRGKADEHSIQSLILSGRDALINGFKEYLNATVRLPIETANVWSNIYDLDKKIPHIDYIDSLDYAVAIGLALPKIER